jgi:hypothetical protein
MAFHIASEYATHYDDMAGPLDDPARTAWRAKVSLFGLKEADKPVEVSQTGNEYLVRTGDSEATLTQADFVEAVTARPTTAPLPEDLRQALKALA